MPNLQSSLEQTLQQAETHHKAKQWQEAEWLYRAILQIAPLHPNANHNLGVMSVQMGLAVDALPYLRIALEENPCERQYWLSYIDALLVAGQREDAKFVWKQGVQRGLAGPEVDEIFSRLDTLQQSTAVNSVVKKTTIYLEPLLPANEAVGEPPRRAMKKTPRRSGSKGGAIEQLIDQADQLQQAGHLSEAIATYRRALKFNPSNAKALNNLGVALQAQEKSEDAITIFQRVVTAKPNHADAHSNLGYSFTRLGKLDEAVTSCQTALAIKPDFAAAHVNLGSALQDQGKLDEAIACYRNALSIKPDFVRAYTSLLMALQYAPFATAEEIFREHQRFAECYEAPLKSHWQPHQNHRVPERRLKVGYVSGDFFNHSVAFFIEPILACHDKSQVEVFCYYSNEKHDNHTLSIKSNADRWLNVARMSDEKLEKRIRDDGIDILIDLSGHTEHNRLLVFARKPAPIQVTWIGYAGTTGLTAMDYRITDSYMDPPGLTERYHSETLVRLSDTGAAYRPYPGCPPVNSLPALNSDGIMFASLNNLNKVNMPVVNLWGRILQALPDARLMLGNVKNEGVKQRLIEMFNNAGVAADRLILLPTMSLIDYFTQHQQIDLALDPFPYNGGTTTLHSMWMGVPVITLAGQNMVSRVGVSALSRVGLNEFITHSEDEYLERAVQVATDLTGLNTIRQSLRKRMSKTDCDPILITRDLEEAYRKMWLKWCLA